MVKLYYETLTNYQERATDGLKRRQVKLEKLQSTLRSLATSDNFKGVAADNIATYLQEVHINGIINGLLQAVENLQQDLNLYVIGYPAVDKNGLIFKLIDEELSNHQTELTQYYENYNRVIISAQKTMNNVDHIKTTSGLAKVTKNGSDVLENLNTMKKIAFDQQTNWHRYESDHHNDFSDFDSLISQLNHLVSQYAGGKIPTMAGYQSGGFDLVAGDGYTTALTTVSSINQTRAADDLQARQNISQIRAIQRKYEKTVAKQKKAAIANRKKKAKQNFWIDVAFLTGGIVLGTLTGGLGAAPLLMMAPGLIFQTADLIEDGTAASSIDGKGTNFIRDGYRLFFGKNADTIYSGTAFVTNLVGAGGAYKQLAKQGILTTAKSEAKPILKTFIKEDAKAAMKAVKSNLSVVKPQWFFKEGIKPKSGVLIETLKENGTTVSKATIVNKVSKTYIQEGIRQVTYNTVAKPIISTVSNKIADNVVQNKNSNDLVDIAIKKAINKGINQGITKVTNVKQINNQAVNITTNAIDDMLDTSVNGKVPKVAQRVINNYSEMQANGYQATGIRNVQNIIKSFYRSYAETED